LAEVGDRDAAERIIAVLADPAFSNLWEHRCEVARSLAQCDADWSQSKAAHDAVDRLLTILGDRKLPGRLHAAQAIGWFRDGRAVPQLLAGLGDPNSRMQVAAALGLGFQGDRRGVEPLIEVTKSSRDELLLAAASWALGELHDERAIDPLIALLGRIQSRYLVRDALTKLTGQKLIDRDAWRAWREKGSTATASDR
jgi:HEAT repeat protein